MSLADKVAALETDIDRAGMGTLDQHLTAIERHRGVLHPEALAYLERARGEWKLGQGDSVRASLREFLNAYHRVQGS